MMLPGALIRTDFRQRLRLAAAFFMVALAMYLPTQTVNAQQGAGIAVTMKDHRFQPAEIHAPANRPLTITVKNLDGAAIEFESVSLRVEKVIAAGSAGSVHVRALAPGRYEFFDDFHQEARGALVVE
jgi:cupredoxin-like protein